MENQRYQIHRGYLHEKGPWQEQQKLRTHKLWLKGRSQQIASQGITFVCFTCKKDLPFSSYGNRVRARLVKGVQDQTCKECHSKTNQPNSKKRRRLNNGKRRKMPKPITAVMILEVKEAELLTEKKRRGISRVFGAKVKLLPHIEGALEQICELTGYPSTVVGAIQEVARLKKREKEEDWLNVDFSVENDNLGCVVGRGGSVIKRIREDSKAEVTAFSNEFLLDSSCVRLNVAGTTENFDKAIVEIVGCFCESRKPTKIPYVPKPPAAPTKSVPSTATSQVGGGIYNLYPGIPVDVQPTSFFSATGTKYPSYL